MGNRICVICGAEYDYCPVCSKDSHKPSWMTLFDSQRCCDIYCACVDYRDNKITAKEANEKLSQYDLTDIDNFSNGTKNFILQIQEEVKQLSKVEVVNESVSESVATDNHMTSHIEEKVNNYSNKKKYFKK